MSRLPPEPPSSEITPEPLYLSRREFIRNGALTLATATLVGGGLTWLVSKAPPPDAPVAAPLASMMPFGSGGYDTDEQATPYKDATTYNNFYEFGLEKDEPAVYAHLMHTEPWTIRVEGEVARPQILDIGTLLKWYPPEQRIYRMRCVEGWSMVIPWLGFPLGDLVRRLEPTGNAKFVEFTTLLRPDEMPGQKVPILDWPYVEGLRLDEALHPLTLLAVGLYGKVLPNQNGAPLRLVVPWKYGFKGIKSIVQIRFVEAQPNTTWSLTAPDEYGFYANVNPEVDHPRWSQTSERRIGEFQRRKTLLFNGYAEQVAGLYTGMDLRKNF